MSADPSPSLFKQIAYECAEISRLRYGLPLVGDWLARRKLLKKFRRKFGRDPDLQNPKTFNENILARILFDRDPRLNMVCDKIAVKDYIAAQVGGKYPIDTLGIWHDASKIDWGALPRQFVLKPNHASNLYRMVTDLESENRAAMVKQANRWLRHNYYNRCQEWAYRGIERKLFAEPLLLGPDGGEPAEVVVHVFSGKAKLYRVFFGSKNMPERHGATFNINGQPFNTKANDLVSGNDLPSLSAWGGEHKRYRNMVALCETHRSEMTRIAQILGQNFSYMRVDFYLTSQGPKVGELTPYTAGGRESFKLIDTDRLLGTLWEQGVMLPD